MSDQLPLDLDLPTGYVVVTYAQHAKVCDTRSFAIVGGPRAGDVEMNRGGSGAEIKLCARRDCPLPLSSNAASPDLTAATLAYLDRLYPELRR